jgi:hypothetical protein
LTEDQKAEKAQSALVNRMGVDPEHGWKAKYEVLPGKENVVAELKSLPKMQMKSISQRIWIEKGKQLLGI